jgi:hypothetical protein
VRSIRTRGAYLLVNPLKVTKRPNLISPYYETKIEAFKGNNEYHSQFPQTEAIFIFNLSVIGISQPHYSWNNEGANP